MENMPILTTVEYNRIQVKSKLYEIGETGLYRAYGFGELVKETGLTKSQVRTALTTLIQEGIAVAAIASRNKFNYYLHRDLEIPNKKLSLHHG